MDAVSKTASVKACGGRKDIVWQFKLIFICIPLFQGIPAPLWRI